MGADLSDQNPNVFYELSLRHGLRKPLIQLIEETQPIPFDVAGMRTIHYDLNDLDSVKRLKKELTEQVSAVASGDLIDTPISVALDLETSGDAVAKSLSSILEAIDELRAAVGPRYIGQSWSTPISYPGGSVLLTSGPTGPTGPVVGGSIPLSGYYTNTPLRL